MEVGMSCYLELRTVKRLYHFALGQTVMCIPKHDSGQSEK